MPSAKVFNSITNESWKKIWWLSLFFKILISLYIPFFSDEAYYWVWSKNLQLSYFDHPPMVAWLFYIGQIFDSWGPASRLPFVLLSHLTIWAWCNHLANILKSEQKLILLALLLLHPLLGLGGIVANPDIPFLFFWTLALLAFQSVLKNSQSSWSAILLGMMMGLGFCAKYLIALILPVIFIHLFFNKLWKQVTVKNFLLTSISGLVFSLPVLIWNYQNDWASLSFQVGHGLGQSEWKPKWTLEFILGTSLLLFPPFLYFYFKNQIYKKWDLHNSIFVTLLAFFIYTTFKGDTELNWPVMIYPSFFLLVAMHFNNHLKSIISYSVFFGLLGITLIGGSLGFWGQELHGRLVEGKKYELLFDASKDYKPLYLSTYQSASYFWFLSKEPRYKLKGSSRIDFYDFLPQSTPAEKSFFFMKEQYQSIPSDFLKSHEFTKIDDFDYKFEVYEAKVKE